MKRPLAAWVLVAASVAPVRGAEREGVVADLNGRPVSLKEYQDYLWKRYGRGSLREYLDLLLLESRAQELGVIVTDEELGKIVDDEIRQKVESLYQGNRERFIQEVEERMVDLEDHRTARRLELRRWVLLDRSIQKTRQVSEDALRAKFEELYGPGGSRPELREILILRKRKGAKELAGKILGEIQGGAQFVDMVQAYSDDPFTRKNDGRIPEYSPKYASPGVAKAVDALKEPGDVSQVVEDAVGFHIIQLIGRKVTEFEEKRAEIRDMMQDLKPTAEERNRFLEDLRGAAKIEL